MLTLWGVRSVWRRLLCRLTGREPQILGRCLQCGRCCREIVLCHAGQWIIHPQQFEDLLLSDPGFERMERIGRDADGRLLFRCSWQGADGKCQSYEDRLPLCRSHPGPSLWLRGVDLPRSCGYRLTGPSLFGFLRSERPAVSEPFHKVLQREQTEARTRSTAKPDRNRDENEES